MGGASPHLGAVRAEHVGPAARSLRFALLEPPGLGALSSVRRPNARSRSEIRKFASEGTKQGGSNHQTTILDLARPTAHELSRAGFPPPLTLSCCGTYLQGGNGNGVGVLGDSAALYPAHCRDQRPRVTREKWHGYRAAGLPSCSERRKHFGAGFCGKIPEIPAKKNSEIILESSESSSSPL